MVEKKENLRLFEALELRSEYDARIKTFAECLPERHENRGRLLYRDDDVVNRPAQGFDIAATREEIASLEVKRRKLNTAIQETNFRNKIDFGGQGLSLAEALELRKATNTKIGELHSLVTAAAWERVIYKEGRDIVQESHLEYAQCVADLDRARLEFRLLNRALRTASFAVEVAYRDE
ncbi:MAG TPA: hypothetical protein VMV68_02290 [Spirochaetia bacterium]|nr:hypothetical protein [Spirochaetia bacterium]